MAAWWAILLSPGALLAQPAISPHGVVNGASFMASGLPGGAIAQGSIFSIFGRNLGPPPPSPSLSFPLQTTLGGVSVKVFQGNTAVQAIPTYVSPGQINAIMPSNAPVGMVSVQIGFNNAFSHPSPARVVNNSVGVFTANQSGLGPGILYNFDPNNPQLYNNLQTAAKPGQVITLWGTGLGPVNGPDNVAPPAGNLPTPVEVYVGGQAATVQYSGRSPCCAGVDQIVFPVPASAPTGCWVPVIVRTGGTAVSNAVTMSISSDGSPCSDAGNPLSQPFIKGGNLGVVTLLRSTVHEDIGVPQAGDVVTDALQTAFQQEKGGAFAFNPIFSTVPGGTCAIYTSKGDLLGEDALSVTATTRKYLNAGTSFTVTGSSGGPANVPANDPQSFSQLGYSLPASFGLAPALVLNPGSYTVAGVGGADVGAFSVSITVPQPPAWTNRDDLVLIDRTQPLTLNWSGTTSSQAVAVFGGDADLPTNSSALFVCTAPAGAASFTIPSYVLGAIPASRSLTDKSKSVIYLVTSQAASPATFNANGLAAGTAQAVYMTGKTVLFQ